MNSSVSSINTKVVLKNDISDISRQRPLLLKDLHHEYIKLSSVLKGQSVGLENTD